MDMSAALCTITRAKIAFKSPQILAWKLCSLCVVGTHEANKSVKYNLYNNYGRV